MTNNAADAFATLSFAVLLLVWTVDLLMLLPRPTAEQVAQSAAAAETIMPAWAGP